MFIYYSSKMASLHMIQYFIPLYLLDLVLS